MSAALVNYLSYFKLHHFFLAWMSFAGLSTTQKTEYCANCRPVLPGARG